jgi:hypothetical protein
MRRVPLLLALLVGAATAGPASATPGPEAGSFQLGTAIWFVPRATTNAYTGYFVDVIRTDPIPAATRTEALAFKGPCTKHRTKHGFSIDCVGTRGGFYRLGAAAFAVDPTLSSARLQAPRIPASITWRGRGLPSPGEYEKVSASCDRSGCTQQEEQHGFFLDRAARARGAVFGSPLVSKGHLAIFDFSAGAFVGVRYAAVLSWRTPSGVRVTLRLPAGLAAPVPTAR